MSSLVQKRATATQASDFPKRVSQVTQVTPMPTGMLLDDWMPPDNTTTVY